MLAILLALAAHARQDRGRSLQAVSHRGAVLPFPAYEPMDYADESRRAPQAYVVSFSAFL